MKLKKDITGNYLNLLLKLSSMTLNLITLYGPNNNNSNCFNQVQNLGHNESSDYE